jgi:GNAT superfamily N-acetyltransferase
MAAAGLIAAQQSFTGLRPVQLRQDLAAIADLIEYCFAPTLDAAGRSAIQEMRLISRSGPLLWLMGGLNRALPGLVQGFVWLEKGRLVGNVSISPAGFGRGWVIANVAVHPDFRRHGIARQLMQAALDQITQRGRFATLQVEADNPAARALYESLGFYEQRTFIRWRRATHYRLPEALPDLPFIQRIEPRESGRLYGLAVEVRPNELGGMGWMRPTRGSAFRLSRWSGFKRVLSGSSTEAWGIAGSGPQLDAAVMVEARTGCSSLVIDLLVRRDRQGQLEAPLINEAIRTPGGRYQPFVTEHPADDFVAADIFRGNYFRPERTLVHMVWPVKSSVRR